MPRYTKRERELSSTGFPDYPHKTEVTSGGYISIEFDPFVAITLLGKAGPPPYHSMKRSHAFSGMSTKSLKLRRLGLSWPGCSPSMSRLSIC